MHFRLELRDLELVEGRMEDCSETDRMLKPWPLLPSLRLPPLSPLQQSTDTRPLWRRLELLLYPSWREFADFLRSVIHGCESIS